MTDLKNHRKRWIATLRGAIEDATRASLATAAKPVPGVSPTTIPGGETRRTNIRAFRTNDGTQERTVYARDTAAAVVLLRGRGPGCVLKSFDTIDDAERYACLVGGRVAKPTAEEAS